MAESVTKRARVERVPAKRAVVQGIIAGAVGGVLMAMWSMIYAAATGIGFWMPLKLIAATWFGVDAILGGVGVLLVGILTHMAISSGYGVLFALLLPRRATYGASLLAGLFFAAGVLLLMTFIILPIFDPTMRARVELIPGSWMVAHAIFGASVGLIVPALRRSHATRRMRPSGAREVHA